MTSILKNAIVTYVPTAHVEKSSEEIISAIESASEGVPLIVDFDETLFLRNSTQEYLGSVYPRSLGAAFLTVAKAIKPWRWLSTSFGPGDVAMDWFLVVAATVLFPWTWLIWRLKAKHIAQAYCNVPLTQSINANTNAQLVIMTRGFDFVVNPLIRHFPITLAENNNFQIISLHGWPSRMNRFVGTLERVSAMLGKAAVARSVVITDSESDLPLLEASAVPCLFQWPEAAFVPAMADMYIPLFYSEKVKNPGQSHFVKRVIFGHWVFGVIAWSFISPHPVINAVSLFLLTLSYWCVYEIGYQENDAVGEKYEKKPTLSSAYEQYKSRINLHTPWPWCWAVGLAIPGIALFVLSQAPVPIADVMSAIDLSKPVLAWTSLEGTLLRDLAVWMVYLITIRATFWVYNQANETSRIWIYPLLQGQRLFGIALLAGTSAVGTMLMMSFVIARWIQYCVYRCGGDRGSFPVNVSCFLLLAMLYSSLAMGSTDVMSLITWQAGAAFFYCALRSVRKIFQIKSDLGWIQGS